MKLSSALPSKESRGAARALVDLVALVLFLSLTAAWAAPAEAGSYYGRHYYSAWHSTNRGHSYRYYHYYSPARRSYEYQVAYYPSGRYVYYYNPRRHVYWGRYDLQNGLYSKLPMEKQKASLAAIDETDFPPPGPMPAAEGGEQPMLPPTAAATTPAPTQNPAQAPAQTAPASHCQGAY